MKIYPVKISQYIMITSIYSKAGNYPQFSNRLSVLIETDFLSLFINLRCILHYAVIKFD